MLTAVALAALQARRLARPLEAIARRSAELGDGDFSVRAGHFGVPEIDAIAQGLDEQPAGSPSSWRASASSRPTCPTSCGRR